MHISWRAFDNVSLSNNNLTATLPTHLQSTIATGNGVSSGKWYWEVLVQSTGAIVGITSTTASGQIWNTVNHRGYFSGAAKWGGTSGSSYGTTFSIGDVISILLDMDAGIIEFWKNGVTQGVAFTNVKSLGTVYPFTETQQELVYRQLQLLDLKEKHSLIKFQMDIYTMILKIKSFFHLVIKTIALNM